MGRNRNSVVEQSWETLRLLEINGKYYALQQRMELWRRNRSGARDGGTSLEKMPADNHRLKPLNELVDFESIADDALGGSPVDAMHEL